MSTDGPDSPIASPIYALVIPPLTNRRCWQASSPMAPTLAWLAWPTRRAASATIIWSTWRNGISATTTTSPLVPPLRRRSQTPDGCDMDDGTTSSSDGQYFRAGGCAGPGGAVDARYGIDPGVVLYTHVSGR